MTPLRHRIVFILLSLSLGSPLLSAQNNALWIWNTRQLITEPVWRDSLTSVTEELKINTLFLFFPYTMSPRGDSLEWYRKDDLIALLRWAKERSYTVHAMAGEPEWALRRNHHRPLTFAREVMRLQKETGMPDGIQFDIEPYLLMPYSLPRARTQLLQEWVNIVWKTGKLLRDSSSLEYGIAVPFWMEQNLTVDGMTMPVAQHMSYLTDYLAVMSYRNKAAGPASVISFSEQERRWAKEAQRKLYVGVETQRLGGGITRYLCQFPAETLQRLLNDPSGELADFHYRGRKLSAMTIDSIALVGVSGEEISDEELLALRNGMLSDLQAERLSVPYRTVEEMVFRSEEGEQLFRLTLKDGSPAFGIRSEEQKRSSMFGMHPEDFKTEYSILLRHAERHPEVVGVAVHDLRSVSRLLRR